MLLGIIVLATPHLVSGQLIESMATGATGKTYRKRAITKIPFQQMTPAVSQKVSDVVNGASLYRQLPVTTIESDPDLYLFLLRYPETIISTWGLMDVSEMTATRTGPYSLTATDGAGTTTSADLIYGDPTLNIYYAEGEYDGPMILRKVKGKCVIVVESEYRRGQDGKVRVTSRMNFFLKIDNLAASIIAKTIHPLVGTTADHNFVETLKFAEKLSETAEKNGPGVQRMANRLKGLDPNVQRRFQELVGLTFQRAQTRSEGAAAGAGTAIQGRFASDQAGLTNPGTLQPAGVRNVQNSPTTYSMGDSQKSARYPGR